jgi:hypothetical protein
MKHVLPRLRSPTPISPLALDDPLDIGDVNEELWRGRQTGRQVKSRKFTLQGVNV